MDSGPFLKMLIPIRHHPLIAFEPITALVSHQVGCYVAEDGKSQAA